MAKKEDKPDPKYTTGSDAWRANAVHGRPPTFKSAAELQFMVDRYFDWLEANPLQAAEVVRTKRGASLFKKPLRRVALLSTLYAYLGIDQKTWHRWRTEKDGLKTLGKEEADKFRLVLARAEERVRADKFEGATAGLYSNQIISRDLGLVEKKDVTGSVTINIGKDDADL